MPTYIHSKVSLTVRIYCKFNKPRSVRLTRDAILTFQIKSLMIRNFLLLKVNQERKMQTTHVCPCYKPTCRKLPDLFSYGCFCKDQDEQVPGWCFSADEYHHGKITSHSVINYLDINHCKYPQFSISFFFILSILNLIHSIGVITTNV